MFDRLRSALSTLTQTVTKKTLDEKSVGEALWQFELALIESDVAQEVAEALIKKVRGSLLGLKVDRTEDVSILVKKELQNTVKSLLQPSAQIDLRASISSKKASGEPYVIVFLGINGTGKTTTIAKVAHLLKTQGFSCVLACADTFRAGAIEQMSEHARRLSLKVVAQDYGADPAAVARDGVLYAKSHKVDVVLVDTAGRMQTSRNLMDEMTKIIRVVNPDLKIFVGDSLAGNDAVSQAKTFFSHVNFDAVILTKVDADVKGGSALSIANVTGRPIIFLGNGQSYDSLKPFSAEEFASLLLEDDGRQVEG